MNEKPCFNRCIRKGTESLDQPLLMGALHGNFCDREFFAMKLALTDAAQVIEHVTSLTTVQGKSEANVQSSQEAPLPFNMTAFNDANETYRRLVYWTNHWAARLHRQAPVPARRAWRDASGRVVGLPADVTAPAARYAVSIMSTWLLAHLDDICWQNPADDVLYFHDELGDVFRIAARWPFEMKTRYAKIQCPHDGSKIVVYPPQEAGEEMRIICESGHVYDEDSFEFYVRYFKQIQDEEAKVARLKQRLARKYVA